jgi:hypothetical protein
MGIEDFSNKKIFDDTILHSYAHQVPGVEIHNPDAGEGKEDDPYVRSLKLDMIDFYLPYSILIPKNIEGLINAGRCISVTHEGDAWIRGQPTCMLTGQVAGIASAISAKTNDGLVSGIPISILQDTLNTCDVDIGNIVTSRNREEDTNVQKRSK